MINLKRRELTNWARAVHHQPGSLPCVCKTSAALTAIGSAPKLGSLALWPNYYGSVDKTAVEVVHHIFVKSLIGFFFNCMALLFVSFHSSVDLLYVKPLRTDLNDQQEEKSRVTNRSDLQSVAWPELLWGCSLGWRSLRGYRPQCLANLFQLNGLKIGLLRERKNWKPRSFKLHH